MIQVVPAIIPHTKEQLEEEIKKVCRFAHLVQIDISDGVFTPVKTWPYNGHDTNYFEELKTEEVGWPKWEDVQFEVHLMVKFPENVVLDWIHTAVSTVVAHIEATDDFQKIIDICREYNISVGIAIKPSTDFTLIAPFVPKVDFIQCMGSDHLGKHGGILEPEALEKIKILRGLYPESIIAIDIGVNEDSAEDLISAGANKLISGGAILDAPNPETVYNYLSSL